MDPQLHVTLNQSGTSFAPGQHVSGTVRWSGAKKIQRAAIRLYHSTSGVGTTDTIVAAEQIFDLPRADDQRAFSFITPAHPPSFSGKLITLSWGIELVLQPGGHSQAVELTIAPGGSEIRLPLVESPATAKQPWWKPKRPSA